MSEFWKASVEFVNVVSAIVGTVGAMLGYLRIARTRFWWPFNLHVPTQLKGEMRRLLYETTRINPITRIEVQLTELTGDSVWVRIGFRQTITSITKKAEPLNLRFVVNGRTHRNLLAKLDGRPVAPSTETESSIVVSSQLLGGQTRECDITYEMVYHASDSELFVSYRPGDRYEFSIIDKVSEAAQKRVFVCEIEPLFTPERIQGLDFSGVPGHPFSKHLSITGGYTSFSGVYLKWRKVS